MLEGTPFQNILNAIYHTPTNLWLNLARTSAKKRASTTDAKTKWVVITTVPDQEQVIHETCLRAQEDFCKTIRWCHTGNWLPSDKPSLNFTTMLASGTMERFKSKTQVPQDGEYLFTFRNPTVSGLSLDSHTSHAIPQSRPE